MDGRSEGSFTVNNYARPGTSEDIRSRFLREAGELMTINILPDDVLIEIFDFYMMGDDFFLNKKPGIEEWNVLAHVCRRWRHVVFQSPRHFNLRLVCTLNTPARDTLDVWPHFPLIISDAYNFPLDISTISDEPASSASVDNIIAALERNDCVCQIELIHLRSSQLKYVTDSSAMRKPFPELTDLHLRTCGYDSPSEPILHDSFLGGIAPRLRSLRLYHILGFPGLPRLLLSATQLIELDLDLEDTPSSESIPPRVMATSISALTSLESLHLRLRSLPVQEWRYPPRSRPPLTRSVLSSLTKIWFRGPNEYLEEILAWIDAPRVNKMYTRFPYIFDTVQLFRFISRSPTLRAPEKGCISFDAKLILVRFFSQTSDHDLLNMEIPYMGPGSGREFSLLMQICIPYLPPVSTLEELYIRECAVHWLHVENIPWLDILHPFAAVKNLYLEQRLVSGIARTLQELVEGRVTEILPNLENIFLTGCQPLHEGIEKFVAARRLTSHPVVVVYRWDYSGMGIYNPYW